MEKGSESWFHYQRSDRQSPHLNFSSDPLGAGKQSFTPAWMNPCTNEVPTNGTFPSFVFSGLPQSKAGQATEPCNWFYCLPRFRQQFVPPFNSELKEKLPSGHIDNCGGTGNPNAGTGCVQKKFLVFDKSGDQTTLIYSSGLGAPVQCQTPLNPKPPAPYNLFKEDLGIKRDSTFPFPPFMSYEHNEENHKNDEDGEMREDTEELNALLYSDDGSDYSDDDDEVTSTGHSPSTLTYHGVHKLLEEGEEGEEEVASSFGPTKRQKLLDEGYRMLSPVEASSSEKPFKMSEFEDDAESNCGNFDDQVSEESNSLSGKKMSRKEKIHETISILQSMIPGGSKGKDAAVVIDEAIHYLKSLKVKAKALGLDDSL